MIKTKKKLPKKKKNSLKQVARSFFWFSTGAIITAFLLASFAFFIFEYINHNVVFPGITIDNVKVEKQTENQVKELLAKKNESIGNIKITFSLDSVTATVSAKDIEAGYDQDLLAKQAIVMGRSESFLSNINIVFQAYFNGLNLPPAYHYSEDKLNEILAPFIASVNKDPVDALFNFENGKVVTFKASEDGKAIDINKAKDDLLVQLRKLLRKQQLKPIVIPLAVQNIPPKITTDKVNNLGIKELIGKGASLFHHSIQNRIFNLTLAALRINGILIAPDEEFSFNKALGDVSFFTGYQQAYVIKNGKTVLGDGGGVCQVSTTFFRALLNAGLPITERHAHAYRVGYYEQDGLPGLDATIYAPTTDLKFKNDTGHYILVQTKVNQDLQQLSVFLYGTSDGRTITLSQPIITNRIPPPPDLYQDDPTLAKGIIKQIDFAAEGARVSFTRTVMKNGKKITSESYASNYAPWQSVFLRGTKE